MTPQEPLVDSLVILASDVLGVGAWKLDVPQRVFSWSKNTARVFGLERTFDADQATFIERVHPHERRGVEANFESALRTGQGTFMQFRIRRQDGALRRVACLGQPTAEVPGSPDKMLGIVFDITGRASQVNRDIDAMLEVFQGSQRNVLTLACNGELTAEEIASYLGLPLGIVRAYLLRGWEQLAKLDRARLGER